MPYSSNPLMYPPEMLTLVGLLERTTLDTITIPVESRSEALSRRTHIQAFFSAIGKAAKSHRELADRTKDKTLKAAQLSGTTKDNAAPSAARQKAIRTTDEDAADAEMLAGLWEDRHRTTMGWMVKAKETPSGWGVELSRRSMGDFGARMLEAFGDQGAQPTTESRSPSWAQSTQAHADTHPALPQARELITEGIAPALSQEELLRQAREKLAAQVAGEKGRD